MSVTLPVITHAKKLIKANIEFKTKKSDEIKWQDAKQELLEKTP